MEEMEIGFEREKGPDDSGDVSRSESEPRRSITVTDVFCCREEGSMKVSASILGHRLLVAEDRSRVFDGLLFDRITSQSPFDWFDDRVISCVVFSRLFEKRGQTGG